ncbi:MAG TPA: winged helix-turn-helix domain-containing protein [Pyrinomonadaceae bacterium]
MKERVLLRDGQPVPLTPKAFDTLLVLIQNSGVIMQKRELLDKVWPDTFVGEATLSQNIFTLRKVLGLAPPGSQYIETIPKRGYRFVEKVRQVPSDSDAAKEEAAATSPAPHSADKSRNQNEAIDSLAILPFVSEGDDTEAEYLSEGITESIINSLSLFSNLKVVARSIVFRHRSKDAHPQEVGRQLGVRALLLGRVIHFSKRIIVRVELVDVENGWQLWGEQYDRELEDVLAVQEEIADLISETIRLQLPGRASSRQFEPYTEGSEAGQLYLRGRYHFNKHTADDYLKAIEYFDQSVAKAPFYARAYAALADALALYDFYGLKPSSETMSQAKAAAAKALEIDDELPEAHTSLAYVLMLYDFDWIGANREFTRSLKLNPNCIHTHYWQSRLLLSRGQFNSALAASVRAMELDSLNISSNLHLGWCYFYTSQYERAIEQMQKIIEMERDFWPARVMLGSAYVESNKIVEAIEEFQRASKVLDSPVVQSYLGRAYALSGDRARAKRIVGELKQQAGKRYVPPYFVGMLYATLDEKDSAFEWLEKAYEARNQWLGFLKIAPEFHNLRDDSRFNSLLKRLRLS